MISFAMFTRFSRRPSAQPGNPQQLLSPLTASDPKLAPVSPFLATDPKLLACKSFACHRSEKQGERGRLRLTPLCTLRETPRGRRQVAGCGARCHNPASGKTTCSRSDLRVGNMSYGG